ncbi:PLP-dependent aminotransferase family protein [Pseudohoeflea coraliihabitans]|uniref:PLP-dependent aminotransferase family protein n=1 Tax=Pseudohoeflea coraliihabitans TaxID=2860393 RepID=A0ABS6WIN5_9HYPH|nr:PLP-dependent aminotransferase family protein [Pseudohoeflea sp. DP4N28-3]MBW3095807.1 PLP-dependent aminotransferase family protein [Pseudohoeflea sp. DP4N28-3]
MWVPDLSRLDGPRYLALARAINEAIDSGALPPGAQLPPQRNLARELNVTVGTVGRAYKIVRERRLVSGEVGRGTFVRGNSEGDGQPSYLPSLQPGTIDFALFAANAQGLSGALSTALQEVANCTALMPMNRYPPAAGFPTHCAAGATWISRSGFDASADRVLICNGTQQGLMAVLLALLDGDDDEVLCEKITYSGMKALSVVLRKKLRGIEVDESGLVPEALERAIADSPSRLLYLQPTVHNPTGASMPPARRRRIADLAIRYDLTVIEDDSCVGGLTKRPAPIATLAPSHTIYMTGLSKSVSPAVRAAYIACPGQFYDRIVNTMHAMTLANSPLVGEVAASLINSGAADKLATLHFEKLEHAHAIARKALGDVPHRSNPAASFIWIELPSHWTSREFCDAARQIGISVVPSENHTASGTPPQAIRIAINHLRRPELVNDGIDKLKRLFSQRLSPSLTV